MKGLILAKREELANLYKTIFMNEFNSNRVPEEPVDPAFAKVAEGLNETEAEIFVKKLIAPIKENKKVFNRLIELILKERLSETPEEAYMFDLSPRCTQFESELDTAEHVTRDVLGDAYIETLKMKPGEKRSRERPLPSLGIEDVNFMITDRSGKAEIRGKELEESGEGVVGSEEEGMGSVEE